MLSAVLLGWESRLFGNTSSIRSIFSNLMDDDPASSGSGAQEAELKTTGEARPLRIAVTDSEGAHYGAAYDIVDVGSIYDKTVGLFGVARVSSQTPAEVEEKDWRAALKSPGVYFEYMSAIPLSVLDGWFGAALTDSWEGLSAQRLCLIAKDGKSFLYFQDAVGQFYAAESELSAAKILELTAAYETNQAYFAFEVISTALDDPYALLLWETTAHPVLDAESPLTAETKIAVLQKLGVSEHQKPITDEDGNQDYIDSDTTVMVSPDGTVKYTLEGNPDTTPVPAGESAAVERARYFAASTVGSYCGAAKIYFDAVSSPAAGIYVVTFKYVMAGGLIHLGQDGYAAAVTIKDGIISEAELHFRSYAVSESVSETALLPELQAAAAAGGAFMLGYIDNGNDQIEPSWVVPGV